MHTDIPNPYQNVLLDYVRFKNQVKELCNIVEQLLNDALSVTCNIEDALNVLQSLHYFSDWPQLNSHFQKKTNDVYAMLIEDISLAMQFYTDNSYQIPSFMIQYSGVCITAMTEYKRIETLKNVSICVSVIAIKIIKNTMCTHYYS
ncbi:unnamed protein product [Macrosiphum euphorbiae]|uniref:Dynein heavy chain tail domain-containing protein n=1 Tax=Macrosiphum euphorbiae TaxID=13131 RepID=A0AAV0X941_9HEMI|nr:unnamed protein product [Macrosiphum euphorbiae]